MFNCIESDALMDVCRALGLIAETISSALTTMDDVFIVARGSIAVCEPYADGVPNYTQVEAFRLSDYLLATARLRSTEALKEALHERP